MSQNMICAIHQPNFFPWLGYFNKIAKTDIFVFLNQVDYEKSGHSMQCYTNRVAINRNGVADWIHCPVIREHGAQSICKVKINNKEDWRTKVKNKLEISYKNAKYYKEYRAYIWSLIDRNDNFIADYNMNIIKDLILKLELSAKVIQQDEITTESHSTRLLIEITKAVNCNRYMCGKGGNKYQKEELFKENNIELIQQNFIHPHYNQGSLEFIEGLSILDAIFYCGLEETKKLIRGN